MAKKKTAVKAVSGASPASNSQPSKSAPSKSHEQRKDSVRETVESVVIAFVLAFLFRTFEAEAFVIPTGSMAPTLLGRHKDVVCAKCGFSYRVNASEEVDKDGQEYDNENAKVVRCTCPVCRYTMDVSPDNRQDEDYPSYKGDRILVGKFPYEFGDPHRWDVIVFRYPEEAQTNFIKRLVGLPKETVQISHGDILTSTDDSLRQTYEWIESLRDHPWDAEHKRILEQLRQATGHEFGDSPVRWLSWWRQQFNSQRIIQRKPPKKLRAVLQIVHDYDFMPAELIQAGWPDRWQPVAERDAMAWTADDVPAKVGGFKSRGYETDGKTAGETWLRYRHFVPTADVWENLEKDRKPSVPPKPTLITDFAAYNTNVSGSFFSADRDVSGLHWVGDLALECELESHGDSGQVLLELIEGGRKFHCRLDLTSGQAALSIPGLDGFAPTAATGVRGKGRHKLLFANVDDELVLWVDDSPVEFNVPATFDPLNNHLPTRADLSPLGIASDGAAVKVSHLKVWRDLYYIATRPSFPMHDYTSSSESNIMSNPEDPESQHCFQSMREVEFPLQADQFLVLGDNSARSKDSRLWNQNQHFVARDLLIGKALYIYWPHSFDRVPGTSIPFPMFPNFERMGFVR